jgi:hypothetical protein
MKQQAEVIITAITNGNYMIRIEDEDGVKEVSLSPSEFAKAITGKLAKGESIK